MFDRHTLLQLAPSALNLGGAFIILASILCSEVHSSPLPGLSIVIKPIREDNKVNSLEVTQTLTDGLPTGDTLLRFQAPIAVFGVKSVSDKITDLIVTDATGIVPLTIENDPSTTGNKVAYRHWQATRKTTAPVSVSYLIAAQSEHEGGGPPYGMKSAGQGVAGSGRSFLLLPENTTTEATQLRWDLSQLPADSIGVVTAVLGDVTVDGPPSEVASQWMLAGPARVFDSLRSPGFRVYMIGKQPFNETEVIDFADRGYAVLSKFLKYLGSQEYRLLFRGLDVESYATGSARESGGGAMITVGKSLGDQSLDDLKTTIFHEMAHQWVGDLSGAGLWFVEGLTVYLTAVLPCESGMETIAFCAHGINTYAPYYYGAAARNWSLDRINNTVGDENARRVPYGRGLVYFALVNAQLLERSNGERGLLDVLRPMFVDRTRGVRLDEAAWEKILLRELGQSAVEEFRASVLDGTLTIVPPSGAFGKGLERVKIRMPVQGSAAMIDGYEWRPIGKVQSSQVR